jgi:hypothetical protein
MTSETETDTLITQVQAFKDIIDECEQGLMNAEQVNMMGDKSIAMVTKSLERVEENKKAEKEEPEMRMTSLMLRTLLCLRKRTTTNMTYNLELQS